jgi:acetate kinase
VLNEAEETVCKQSRDIPMPTHSEAIAAVLDILVDPTFGVVKSRQMRWTRSVIAYCTAAISLLKSCIVDEACKQAIEECIPLGPLHNPANLRGILACEKAMPGKKQVAVFDTAFHMTMPPEGLPLRHSYAILHQRPSSAATASTAPPTALSTKPLRSSCMGKKPEDLKLVICHLGNGSSLSAVARTASVRTPPWASPRWQGFPWAPAAAISITCIVEYHDATNTASDARLNA